MNILEEISKNLKEPEMSLDEFDDMIHNNPNLGKELFEKVKKESFEKGVEITYKDEKGRMVAEYPDGRIMLLEVDEEKDEYVETKMLRKPQKNA